MAQQKLPWVQGNKLDLALPLTIVEFKESGKETKDYIPQDGDEVKVYLQDMFCKNYEFTPTIVDDNVLHIVDNGTLPVGSYSVLVTIKEHGTNVLRRSKWNYIIEVYDSNEKVVDFFDDFPDYVEGAIIENSVFYFVGTAQAEYVNVSSISELPIEGDTHNIYRVANYDGTQVVDDKYCEYAWDGSSYQLLAVHSGSLDGVYDISANNLTEGQPTQYADLAAALNSGNNVPEGVRAGGMSVKFIQSSNNKYVQYFLTKNQWSASEADWEKMNLEEEVIKNSRVIIRTSEFAGNTISSLQAYAAGSTEIRTTTSNYWLYLYKIPAYSYYTINRASAPADTFAIVGLIDSPQSFAVGGNLSKVLLWGSDASGVDHTYFTEEETYLVVLGNSSNEKRYAATKLTTTKSISDKIDETERTLSANIDTVNNKVAFLDEGKELRENLSFIRAFYHATNGVQASTTRLLSRKIEGKEGLLTISTANAASDLRVIWVRCISGQTPADAVSNWLTDKHLNIHLLEGYDYYIQIAKTDDGTITIDDISSVEIYFDKGDIISCNKDTIPNLANMCRPKHNYSSSGTYQPCLSIAYFSDVHANTNNIRRIIEFVGKYGNFIDDVLQTGDLIAGDLSGGIPSNWTDLGKNILGVIGNHDAQNKVGGIWVTQPAIDSYNAVFAPFISNWGVTQPQDAATNGYCYWYKDYDGQNVRLIALDCMHWDATQKTWFETTLASAKTANYSVVVAVHYLPFTMQHTETAFDSIDFTPTLSGGDFFASQEIPDAIADFMTNGGKFICYLTGHVHIDLCGVGELYPNQFCISIACASADNTATIYGDTERVKGSKSEDCLNIVAFDTSSKTIKITRIGIDHDRYMRTKDFVSFNYETKEVIS